MATAAELQRERKQALAEVRRRQRAADTAIERIERRLAVLRDRKSIIDAEAALTLVPLWDDFLQKVTALERGLSDFLSVVQI